MPFFAKIQTNTKGVIFSTLTILSHDFCCENTINEGLKYYKYFKNCYNETGYRATEERSPEDEKLLTW